MGLFQNIVLTMSEAGMNLFLPWLLILSVTYGLLNKYNIIADEPQVNGAASLAFSFLVIIGVSNFAPPNMWAHFAANIAFGVFGFIGFLILLGVAGFDLSDMGSQKWIHWTFAGTIAIVSFVGILVQYGDASGIVGPGETVFDQIVMPVLILVFLLVVVIMTTR